MINEPCPLCGEPGAREVGPIIHPEPATVAGIPIDLGDRDYVLARCGACGFSFKWPAIDDERLLACYEQASAVFWEEMPDPRQRRFDDLRALIAHWAPSGRLLDVGCYNGALQLYLGDAWQHFGVEPSREAAAMAEARGVRILGADLGDIAAGTKPFDAIVAVDLIEHLTSPLAFVRQLATLLAPGGIAVFVTGDTDAWSWRLSGSRYWYCALPEHVSFFNERSMQFLAGSSGLESVAHERTSHLRVRPDKRLRKLVKNTLVTAFRRIPGLNAAFRDAKPPHWATATDHMMHVMRRPGVDSRRHA